METTKQAFDIYRRFARIIREKEEYDLCIACEAVDRLSEGLCPTCWAKKEIDKDIERRRKEKVEGKLFMLRREKGWE